MKKRPNKTNRLVVGLVAGLLLLGSAVVFASNSAAFSFVSARPQVLVNLNGSVDRDNQKLPIEKLESVTPGDILHWTITSENKGDGEAQEYKAVGKIPSGTSFVAESAKAQGAAEVVYSLDGGKTFAKQPLIDEKQADGSVKSVPAPVSKYTNVRFDWKQSLSPGEKLTASYDVRVK